MEHCRLRGWALLLDPPLLPLSLSQAQPASSTGDGRPARQRAETEGRAGRGSPGSLGHKQAGKGGSVSAVVLGCSGAQREVMSLSALSSSSLIALYFIF